MRHGLFHVRPATGLTVTKSAFILDEQGKRREAVQALQSVLRDYPKSSVEPLARQRLADIQKR